MKSSLNKIPLLNKMTNINVFYSSYMANKELNFYNYHTKTQKNSKNTI